MATADDAEQWLRWRRQAKSEGVLKDDEIARVAKALIEGQGPSTEEEIMKAVNWAQRARIEGAILELALEGRVVIALRDDGELEFRVRGRAQ